MEPTLTLPLKGNRVTLRDFRPEDIDAVYAYSSLPLVTRFTIWPPNTRTDAERFVRASIDAVSKVPRRSFALAIEGPVGGGVIGGARIGFQAGSLDIGDIGYVLHPTFWGQGLATEAVRLLVQFGWESLHLHRIEATCDPANMGSRRVLEKVGFQYEGHLRQHIKVQGKWRDSLLFGLLAADRSV